MFIREDCNIELIADKRTAGHCTHDRTKAYLPYNKCITLVFRLHFLKEKLCSGPPSITEFVTVFDLVLIPNYTYSFKHFSDFGLRSSRVTEVGFPSFARLFFIECEPFA